MSHYFKNGAEALDALGFAHGLDRDLEFGLFGQRNPHQVHVNQSPLHLIDLHVGDLDRGRGAVDAEREYHVAAVAAQKRREFALDYARARRLLTAAVDGDRDEALRALAARGVLAAFIAGLRFQRDVPIETHYSNSKINRVR